MPLASPEDLAILEGTDTSPETFHRRIAAVWANAHDLAIAKVGESNIGQFFTNAPGTRHLMELEGLGPNATAAEMLAVSRRVLGING